MLSDIDICRSTPLLSIDKIAEQAGLLPDEFETHGKYKAKVSAKCVSRLADKPNGKLVLVTAITPTPLGEGKTTTAVGFVMVVHQVLVIGKSVNRFHMSVYDAISVV